MSQSENKNNLVESRSVSVSCFFCSRLFHGFISSNRKFCSRVCYTNNKRKDMTRTCKYCKKPFDSRNTVGRHKVRNFCTKKCKFAQISKTKTGVKIGPMPLAWREKIGEAQRGERHHNWKGGVYDSMERKIRHSLEYREWRRHVFQRDDYTCQSCGTRGGELNADHELPFALYPDLRFEILNGRTLCVPCHRKTATYGGRSIEKYLTQESINGIPY
jgi:5-methylcytosine-specific restriction endonuclease McrA